MKSSAILNQLVEASELEVFYLFDHRYDNPVDRTKFGLRAMLARDSGWKVFVIGSAGIWAIAPGEQEARAALTQRFGRVVDRDRLREASDAELERYFPPAKEPEVEDPDIWPDDEQ